MKEKDKNRFLLHDIYANRREFTTKSFCACTFRHIVLKWMLFQSMALALL